MLRGDKRGVSPVVGFVLVLAIVIAFIGYSQVAIYPSINYDSEFETHSNAVGDFKRLNPALLSSVDRDTPRSVSVDTTTDYVTQIVPPFNTPEEVALDSVQNATRIEGANQTESYNSTYIYYNSKFNRYTSPPQIRFENTVTGLLDRPNGSYLVSSIVRGNRTYFVPQISSRDRSVSSTDPVIQFYGESETTRTNVTNKTGTNVSLIYKTELPVNVWKEAFREPRRNGTVTSIEYTEKTNSLNTVTVNLRRNRTYTIVSSTIKVGVDGQ